MNLFERDDKKVEYIELIYDLVFVYMVGRNNALLHHFEGGFVAPVNMLAYVMCTLAIAVGVVLTSFGKFRSPGGSIDFMHLTERAMLYVVFTFGEMIITIATYFKGDGSFDLSVIYFSLMAFLIVAGLFLSYGLYYDHLLDREREDNGLLYMILHIFIIFALNNITVSLEFMRMEEVALMPKMVFLVGSVIAYYMLLFIACRYSKVSCRLSRSFDARLAAVTAAFAALMIVFRDNMYINIFITVAYVYTIVAALYRSKVWLDSKE